MDKMKMYSIRLTDHQAAQLDYLTRLYGSQATAFRAVIAILTLLSELDEAGHIEHLDLAKLHYTVFCQHRVTMSTNHRVKMSPVCR